MKHNAMVRRPRKRRAMCDGALRTELRRLQRHQAGLMPLKSAQLCSQCSIAHCSSFSGSSYHGVVFHSSIRRLNENWHEESAASEEPTWVELVSNSNFCGET